MHYSNPSISIATRKTISLFFRHYAVFIPFFSVCIENLREKNTAGQLVSDVIRMAICDNWKDIPDIMNVQFIQNLLPLH